MFNIFKNATNSSNPILRSKILLYVILLIAIFNILNLASHKEYGYVLLFVLVGFLVSFYNKNMNVVLNVLRCGFEDSNTDFNRTEAATDCKENESS